MPAYGYNSMPKGSYPFYNYIRWKQQMTRIQQQYRHKPAFYFQDQSTFYYMSDPIYTADNRLSIQLTKVHIGLNGEQQRVFVEQQFSDEKQLKKFVQNLHANFYKTFEKEETDEQKPGVFVVEEPDEEPKIYQQDANENENYQRLSLKSSCSTIHSAKRQRNYMKYRKSPSFVRQSHAPPRFQKEKDFYPYGRFNGGYPPRQRTPRSKDHLKPPTYPRTVADNLKFPSAKAQQPRLNQSKSNCQIPSSPFYHHPQRQTPMAFYRLFQYNSKCF